MSKHLTKISEEMENSESMTARVIDPREAIDKTKPGSDLRNLLGWAGTGDTTVAVLEEQVEAEET